MALLASRLEDGQAPAPGHRNARAKSAGESAEASDRLGPQGIPDPGAAPIALDPSGIAEDLQVVRHGRLADVAARREVARADLGKVAQLPEDRQPRRVGCGLE